LGTTINEYDGKPLLSTGSYVLDNVTTKTVVTVTAHASSLSDSDAQTQKQVIIPIQPPAATLTATVVPSVNAPPEVKLDWSSTSANAGSIVSVPAGLSQPADPLSGTLSTPFMIPTQFDMTVTNPTATPNTTTVTQTVTPPDFDWVPVGPGLLSAQTGVYLYETHAGLLASAPFVPNYFKISPDGLHWTTPANLPPYNIS